MEFTCKRSITIEKPADDVWKILWTDFGSAEKVLSIVNDCKTLAEGGDVKVDGICARELAMADGNTFVETLVEVEKEKHVLSYSIEGLPLGITPVGTWAISELDDSKVELSVEDKAELSYWPPKFLAYPVFALMLPKVFDTMLADVKHYAETGKPSPAKVEAMEKLSKAN